MASGSPPASEQPERGGQRLRACPADAVHPGWNPMLALPGFSGHTSLCLPGPLSPHPPSSGRGHAGKVLLGEQEDEGLKDGGKR